MSHVMRKPVFRVSDQVRNKLGCTTTEDGKGFEISRFRKERDCTIYVAKTKALCSYSAADLCFHICKKQVFS